MDLSNCRHGDLELCSHGIEILFTDTQNINKKDMHHMQQLGLDAGFDLHGKVNLFYWRSRKSDNARFYIDKFFLIEKETKEFIGLVCYWSAVAIEKANLVLNHLKSDIILG